MLGPFRPRSGGNLFSSFMLTFSTVGNLFMILLLAGIFRRSRARQRPEPSRPGSAMVHFSRPPFWACCGTGAGRLDALNP